MARRLIPALLALLVAAGFSVARRQLVGIESDAMSAWPSHVIFGLYFAVFTLALQALHHLWTKERDKPHQLLLMLILACICCDLVLVNVQEVLRGADASYGLVVIWDMATFLIWLRAIEIAAKGDDDFFNRSLAVSIAPVLALGREILFLPYGEAQERAYLDFVFGNCLVALWPLAVGLHPGLTARRSFVSRLGLAAVLWGCVYWLANAVEHLIFLAWPPSALLLYALSQHLGVPIFSISIFYAGFSLVVTLAIWLWVPRLAERFDLRPARTASAI